MYERTLDFLSKKGAAVFAIAAWIAFIVGGAALTVVTVALALAFELCVQVKKGITAFI